MTFHSGANLRRGEIGKVEKRDERRWIIAQVKTDLRDVGKPRRNRRDGTSANGGSHAVLIGGAMAAFAWGTDVIGVYLLSRRKYRVDRCQRFGQVCNHHSDVRLGFSGIFKCRGDCAKALSVRLIMRSMVRDRNIRHSMPSLLIR